MIELLMGALLVAITAAFSLFVMWRKERDSKHDAEAKVRAHEELQRIESDIANGGDEYVDRILRESSRAVRSDKTSNYF